MLIKGIFCPATLWQQSNEVLQSVYCATHTWLQRAVCTQAAEIRGVGKGSGTHGCRPVMKDRVTSQNQSVCTAGLRNSWELLVSLAGDLALSATESHSRKYKSSSLNSITLDGFLVDHYTNAFPLRLYWELL